jgi:hypothetical protein
VRWEFRPFGGKDVDADGDEDGDDDASAARSGPPVEVDVDAGWLAAVGADRSEAASQIRIALELERKFWAAATAVASCATGGFCSLVEMALPGCASGTAL